MVTFITGTHHCPDCGQPQSAMRGFVELGEDGEVLTDWSEFICPSGHHWARPGSEAAK